MARLFIAAWPPPPACDDVRAALPPAREPGVRRVPEANWHVTLRFLGDVDDTVRSVLDEALGATTLPYATAVLGPAITRLDRRQIVVPVAGVDDLAAAVTEATVSVGAPPRHRFVGHLTLARTRPGKDSVLLGTRITSMFPVDEVALVESDLRPDGASYRTVATYPTASLG